jgi:hypothetical protein
VFPTEDDRLDLATIMLFQAYTACRPAELVDGTKSRGAADPLLDDSDEGELNNGTNGLEDAAVPRLKRQRTALRPSKRIKRRKRKPVTKVESESASAADSDSDDRIFDSDDETDGDDTTDTEYSDGVDDVDMLQTEQKSSHKAAATEEGEDEEMVRKHKTICYEDIILWIVKDPTMGGRDVLAMEVFFRYHKGADRKPKPCVYTPCSIFMLFADAQYSTIFLFRENPLPILCPISHFLARAIRDDAVDVDGFSHAAPFFSTHLGKKATKVNWKPSKLKTPIFRRSVRTAAGAWTKSMTDPMKYSSYAFYLDRIGSDLGSEEKWTSYCMRRGNANALLKVAPSAVVDQVMRHDPMTGCMANAYLNRRVGFNTQDAFLERDPSADGLTRAFTHMSIRCDAEVPREIPKKELDKLPLDPEVEELTKLVKQTAIQLRQRYGFIKSAPEEILEEYKQLRRDLRNAEKAFKDYMTREYQEAFRRRMHNEELERQLKGVTIDEKPPPPINHELEERSLVQAILCDFNTDIGLEEITSRKIRAIDGMVRLAARREVRQPRSVASEDLSRECSPELAPDPAPKREVIPLLLSKTQCIYCVGDERLTHEARMRKFRRVSHMMDHVENVHMRHEKGKARFVCHHPECQRLGDFLTSLDHFKNHVETVHGVKLRKKRV